MRKTIQTFLILLFSILGVATVTGPAMALDIAGIRLGAHPEKTRVVVELSDAAQFRAFVLAEPTRLVVDLPNFNWRVGNIAKPKGTGIREIRQGPLQPGIARIVIDLDRPSLIRSAFFLPQGQGQPNRIVIDFAGADANAFTQGRGRTYGTLNVNDPAGGASQTVARNSPRNDQSTTAPPPEKPSLNTVSASRTTSIKTTAPIPVAQRPLIVLDPGHGGEDPGALGNRGLMEKNITLAMARDLKKALEDTGRYRVILTRDKDIFIRLSQRVAFARSKKADLFISLHADSINRSGVRGASIYTLSEKASDAETEKLAARENHADLISGLDLSEEDEDVANILVDLTMRDTMNQSKFFANKSVSLLKASGIRTLENPHRYAGFAVLKAPDIPSVLIELGYMSNDQESAMLSNPEYRGKIAGALVVGITDYFEKTGR